MIQLRDLHTVRDKLRNVYGEDEFEKYETELTDISTVELIFDASFGLDDVIDWFDRLPPRLREAEHVDKLLIVAGEIMIERRDRRNFMRKMNFKSIMNNAAVVIGFGAFIYAVFDYFR